MKKRIISLLLTVLMVLSLFSGLSVSAYATTYNATTALNGANTITYTMGAGDYVLRVCQTLGLNYYTCKQAIMMLNNIRDGQWNQLTVGRTLILPASDYDALLIVNGAGTSTYNSGAAVSTATTSNVTGTATTGTATTLNAANTTASADVLGYYLVPYTMSYGETVSGVCNAMGVNFAIFGPFVKQVNNISSWSKVKAGDTLIIPTPLAPSVGTTCYGVMEHIVTNSDTAYGIVSSKGVNYNANERLLKVLNQTENLAALKAGQKFFYPVPLTVTVPGTGNPGSTSTTTTTTTVTDGNGTTTTQTTTTSKLYTLTGGMSASDGTMLFYVDNKPVTAAPAGAKVTIVTSTNSGKAIQSLTVKHENGEADLHLTGDTFIMPSCNARIDAVIKSGHDINISANYSGKASASVGGVSVQSAVKGATVIIKSTDPNYEVSAVYAYYKKLISATTKNALTVSSSNAFIMPDADVDVEVVLKPVSTYAFYVNEPARGSFYLEVNGSPVTRAAKGTQVTVVAKANSGYEPSKLTVTNMTTEKDINVFNNTFTMPAANVEVTVKFAAKGNNILIMPSQVATVFAYVEGEIVDEAGAGETVTLQAVTNPEEAEEDDFDPKTLDDNDYNITYDVVRNSDGLKVKVTDGEFKMPKGGVTITPLISAIKKATITGKIYINNSADPVDKYSDASFSVTYNVAGKENRTEFTGKNDKTPQIPTLEYIDLRNDCADGVAFVRYVVTVEGSTDDEEMTELLTNEANLRSYLQIPEAAEGEELAITIAAHFETGKVSIGQAAITGIGTVSYRSQNIADLPMDVLNADDVRSAFLASLGTSINSANPGDDVYVIVAPGNGYKFDNDKYKSRLIITRKDNGAPVDLDEVGPVMTLGANTIWAYQYKFTMPAVGVDVQVTFDPKPFRLFMKTVDETGKDLSGLGLWQIAVNMEPGIVDNSMLGQYIGTVVDVAYGDYITVAMTEAGWSKYDMVSFRIDNKEYTADVLNNFYNFQMIEDRAKDLEIIAVMRPRVPYSVSVHNLIAANVDPTKGAAQFVILDSPSGYSDEFRKDNNGYLGYVNKAVTGDKVAIVVSSSNSKYTVKPDDITIYADTDADRIIPQESWVDEKGNPVNADSADVMHVFSFTMPDSDVYVSVNFTGNKNGLIVSVWNEDESRASGMVRVVTNKIDTDVGTDFSFEDVAYNTQVSIMRSTLAYAEGKVIDRVEIFTENNKSVPYTDLSNYGEGVMFTMPDTTVWVNIWVKEQSYNLPVTAVNQVTHGSLVFRKTMNNTDPTYSLSDFKKGETVYVFDKPNDGYAHLQMGDLKILSNGVTNIATCANAIEVTAGTAEYCIWSFTLPEGTLIFQADFEKEAPEAPAMTVNLSTDTKHGTIGLNHQDSNKLIEEESAFKVGDTFYFFPTSAVGYELDEENLIVVENATNKQHRFNTSSVTASDTVLKDITKTSNGCYTIENFKIPEGGVTIKASFVAKEVSVKFVYSGTKDSVQITNTTTGQTVTISDNSPELTAKYGDTITMTPVSCKWGTNGATSKQVTIKGTGATAERKFKIGTESAITVTLDIAASNSSNTTSSNSSTYNAASEFTFDADAPAESDETNNDAQINDNASDETDDLDEGENYGADEDVNEGETQDNGDDLTDNTETDGEADA